VRTKIAVDTLERDVDPVGACIGARGSRIQAVVNELRGEKIDVIRWSPDPATYIANSLSPARVDQVLLVDTEEKKSLVLVAQDQLSLAIGKEGQNVRLAARLTGWKIDIKDVALYDEEEDQGLDPQDEPELDESETQESESDSSLENEIAEVESLPTKVEDEQSDAQAESNPESAVSNTNTTEVD